MNRFRWQLARNKSLQIETYKVSHEHKIDLFEVLFNKIFISAQSRGRFVSFCHSVYTISVTKTCDTEFQIQIKFYDMLQKKKKFICRYFCICYGLRSIQDPQGLLSHKNDCRRNFVRIRRVTMFLFKLWQTLC